jgi:hypothetical protein
MMRLLPRGGHAEAPGHEVGDATQGPLIPPPPGTATIAIRLDDTAWARCHGQAYAPGGGNHHALLNEALRHDTAEGNQPDPRPQPPIPRGADPVTRALRRHRRFTDARRAQRTHRRQAHPDGAVDCVGGRSVWFFAKRKISQHRHHCPWCHPKYRERDVRARVTRFMEAHGCTPPRWFTNPKWVG